MNIIERVNALETEILRLRDELSINEKSWVRDRVVQLAKQLFLSDGLIMQESDLISEQDFDTEHCTYLFQPRIRNYSTEIVLEQGDVFVCVGIALMICNPTSWDDVSFESKSFPDYEMFLEQWSGNKARTIAREAEKIYNATLGFVVNNVMYASKISTARLRGDEKHRHFLMHLDQFWILSGDKNINIMLMMPKPIDNISYYQRMRLIMHGFLFKDASIIT